ncbi:MAG: zinc-dependent alcohol dehydrogenase [Hyphomicrobiaceae bacterium]
MQALVYTGPKTLELRDTPHPVARNGDALIKIDSVGICGSDLHAWAGHDARRTPPLILGHEAAGTIVGGPEAGLPVTVNPLVTCGTCRDCEAGRNNLCEAREIISMAPREGAFTEYLTMPWDNLSYVNCTATLEQAALAEPIACGWHAVRVARRAMKSGLCESRCLVLGGGAIGLGASLVLAAHGAREIWIGETNPLRHPFLESSGDFRVFDPSSDVGPGENSVDLVVDAVGIEATRVTASQCVRAGGVIAHIGLGSPSGGLDIRRLTLQEITFLGTYTYAPRDFRETTRAIYDGRLGSLDWMDVRPLSDGPRSFEEISTGKAATPKILLKP